jgi:aspartyl-tRNA(Asn)/glutamyl-tRNA(Gln) amidotransferase subunit A
VAEFSYQTIPQIQHDLKQGKVSCESLLSAYLNRIDNNKHLNAFLEVFRVTAFEQARKVDQKFKDAQPVGKLAGVVVAIKDNICYKGHKVSAGSRILENFTSLYNSTVVERLLAEDAIIIGRTNCDEFAMGSSNENSAYGNVLNMLDNTRVPGGSSGGSAVAVQADMCHVSLGSETGGSVRQPASFCGLVGLKPTYGRISRYGLIAYASSFDQIAPFAKSVSDVALVMEIIAGKDNYDATSSSQKVPLYSKELNFTRKARVAIFPSVLETSGVQPEVKKAIADTVASLKNDGHQVNEVEFDLLDYLIPAYYVLSTAEASSNLARFDGVHYGYRSKNAVELEEVYVKSRSEGFGKEVKNRIMLGTFVLSAGYYDAYYSRAQKVRRLLVEKMEAIFRENDFIMMPTSPTVAFKFGEKTANPVEMYLADIYTVLANLTGNPAISLPLAKGSGGMPVGIQLMAEKFSEGDLLAFSEKLMHFASVN